MPGDAEKTNRWAGLPMSGTNAYERPRGGRASESPEHQSNEAAAGTLCSPLRRVRQVNFVFHGVAPGQELSGQAKCHQKADPPEPGDPVSGRDSGRTPAPRCTPAPRRCGPFAPSLRGKSDSWARPRPQRPSHRKTPLRPSPLGLNHRLSFRGSHSRSSPKAPSRLPPRGGLSPASPYGNERQDSAEAFPCAF